MKDEPLRALIVDDSEDDVLLIIRELKKCGYTPVYQRVEIAETMEKALKEKPWDIILCDYKMPAFNAPSAIALLKETNIDIPIIIISGAIGEETAVECMRLGARDYIMKDNFTRLCPAIEREVEEANVRKKKKRAEKELRESEERFKAQYQGSPIATFTWQKIGEDFVLKECNEAALFVTRGEAKQFINKTAQVMYHNHQDILRDIQRCFEEKVVIKKELQSKHFLPGRDIVATYAFVPDDLVMVHVEDITERKKAEEQLRLNDKIMQNISEGIILIQANNGVILQTNPKFDRMLGYSTGELIGQNVSIVNAPRDEKLPEQIASEIIFSLTETGKWSGEVYNRKKDGTPIWCYANVSTFDHPIFGKLWVSIHTDITGRKQAEEALRESEELYTKLVNAIPDLIVHTDLAGNILFVNDYALQMGGYSREDIVGKNLLTFLSPEDHEDVIKNIQIMTEGPLGPREYHLIIKDGTEIPIEVNGDVLRNEDGTPFGLVNVCRDIRERKRAEESLHAWMRRYDLIVEASGQIAYEYTVSTGDIIWGRSIENVLGYSQDEIKGGCTQWRDLLHPDDRQITLDLLSSAEKACAYWDVQYRMRHKNGHYIWIRDRGFFLPDSGGRAYVQLGMLEDVTQRRQAEEKLQQTLESFKKAVGTTIQVLVSALEARDPYTSGHQSRTAHLACAIATEMGFSEDEIEGIRMAGSIHDIGKLSIPAEILVKPTKLTRLEFSLIKEHAKAGYEMLKDVESPWPLAQIVLQHHERLNGSGYPGNLKGDEIIPEARIMAVADVVEAMASHRPYRASLGIEPALEEIKKNKGLLYDDAVVDACLKLFREKGYHLIKEGLKVDRYQPQG